MDVKFLYYLPLCARALPNLATLELHLIMFIAVSATAAAGAEIRAHQNPSAPFNCWTSNESKFSVFGCDK